MIAELMPSPARTALRPYQELAIEHVRRTVNKHQRAYFNMPTGCGKTVVLSALTERYDRAVLIAHRKELIEQIAGRLRSDWDRSVGIVMGSRNEPYAELVVGTEQSLRPERLDAILQEPVDALLIDEAHHAVPNSHYAKIAERMWEANPDMHVIGCTATPYRADKRRMQDFLPVCAFSRTIDQMQTEGWLCPFTWHTVQVDWNLAAIGTRTIDGEQDYDLRELAAEAEDEATVDAIVEHTAHLIGDRPTCVFGVSVEHAKMLAESYSSAGFRAAAVWGNMPKEERKTILRLWQEGYYQIVCNMGILTEGFDFPGIRAVVMARPTRSQSLYVQCIGRGSRLAPGKTDCIVIDVAGNGEIDDTLQILLPDVASVEEPEDNEGTARQGQLSGMRRQKIARDPSMDRTYRWLAEEGHYALSASDGIILVMVEDPNGSGLYQLGALRNDGAVARVSRQPDPIWEQYRVAQSWLETNSVKALAGREQPWHAKPASEKQLWLLRKLDAAAAIPGMSRRQAAEAITSAMVRKHYPRLRYHLWGVRP